MPPPGAMIRIHPFVDLFPTLPAPGAVTLAPEMHSVNLGCDWA